MKLKSFLLPDPTFVYLSIIELKLSLLHLITVTPDTYAPLKNIGTPTGRISKKKLLQKSDLCTPLPTLSCINSVKHLSKFEWVKNGNPN